MKKLATNLYLTLLLSLGIPTAAIALEDSTIDMEALQQAWRLPTGGANNTPYYQLEVNGMTFFGERPWEVRWNMIKDVTDYRHKRILEIGSNVGLASVFLMKYRQPAAVTIVDRPPALAGKFGMAPLWDVIGLVHKAFGVAPQSLQLDLNTEPYEVEIGTHYDVVIAMSILKWVDDKERFLSYLAHFPEVIYEGHDSDEIEIERFANYGFTNFQRLGSSHVGASYPADACRTVFYFSKS